MAYVIKEFDPKVGYAHNGTVDLARFAKDLAKELGGRVYVRNGEDEKYWKYVDVKGGRLTIGYDFSKGTFNFGIDPLPEINPGYRNVYDKSHRTERAHVSAGRPIAAIAKDVKRRVIDASQVALKNQRDYAANKKLEEMVLDDEVARFQKVKGVSVSFHPHNKDRAMIYSASNSDGPYFRGALSISNGKPHVHLESIGGMSVAKFKKLVKVLQEKDD